MLGQESPVSFEYYQPTFRAFLSIHHKAIEDNLLHKPLAIRHSYYSQLEKDKYFSPSASYQLSRAYLGELEKEIERVLKRHSVFFWLHIYRRIGVSLSKRHEDKTDPNTILLVREIVELAIVKYSNFKRADDVKLAKNTALRKILGGHFLRHTKSVLKGMSVSKADISNYFREFKSRAEWVLEDFQLQDFLDIYFVEGLAYEYWRTTAQIRAVGKGALLKINDDGDTEYQKNIEFVRLVQNYDQRIGKNQNFSTLFGIWTDSAFVHDTGAADSIIYFQPNAFKADITPMFEGLGVKLINPDLNTPHANFVPGFINFIEYMATHRFLNEEFIKRMGFGLDELMCVLWGVSNIGVLPLPILISGSKTHEAFSFNLLSLCKRAYAVYGHSQESNRYRGIIDRLKWSGQFEDSLVNQVNKNLDAIISFLSLAEDKQKNISLWSRGPRFMLLPYADYVCIDYTAVQRLLITLFTYFKENGDERGFGFEKNFRDALEKRGFEVLKTRNFYDPDGKQIGECDAPVKINETLYLIECKSTQKALNTDAAPPEAVKYRIEEFEKKLKQVRELGEYLQKNSKNSRYDVSWAKNVVTVVVSPFIEWIWDVRPDLWLEAGVPAVLSADEAIDYLERKRG